MRLCRWGAGLAHVGEDFIDDVRVGDICDDSQVAATQSADSHVEFKRAFKALGPGQWRGFGRLALVRTVRWVGRVGFVGAWLARPAGHDPVP
jgi:hypothetical protein